MVAATNVRLHETNRERDEVIGKHLFDLFPDNPNEPEANGVRNLRESLERVLRTKAPDIMALQKYDIPQPEKGGGFDERYWSVVNSPMLDETGGVAYIIHCAEDVTDFVHLKEERDGPPTGRIEWRLRAERLEAEIFERTQEVQRSNERLRSANEAAEALLRSISDGFVSLDREWRFLYINGREAELIGKPAEELIGKSFWDYFPEPPDGVLRRELGRAMDERVAVEFDYFDEEGCRWLEKRAYPSSQGISCLANDVTARKRAETRLAAEHLVTRTLSEARSFDEAWPALVPSLCGILEAQVAGLWLVDEQKRELYCVGLHRCDDSEEAKKFAEESQRFRFVGGESLPGRVWAEGKGLWIADFELEENLRRKQIAIRAGLRSAVAFPIAAGGDFFGVIEFFFKRLCEEDSVLADITTALGSQIAQFIQRKRAEQKQQRSEVRYRRLFEAALDGVLILDPETGRIVDANPFIAGLLGCSREELEGKELWEIGLTADARSSRAFVEELRRNGSSRYEISVRSRTGQVREVEMLSNLYPEDGAPAIQCNIRDQTERKAAEVTLAERARLLDLSSDAIIACDPRNHITSWNRGAEDLFGWSNSEAIGKDLHALLRTELEAPFDELMERLRREGRLTGEIVQTTRDGRRLNLLCRWALMRASDGTVVSILTTTTDITEQKRVELALRKSERQFRGLVTASSEVLYRMNPDWSEMVQLRGGAFLADQEEPNRNWLTEYIPPEEQARVRAAVDQAIRTKSVFKLEHRVRRMNGSVGWTISRAVPHVNERGEIEEWFGAATDITERKEAEEALRRSEARLAQAVEVAELGTFEHDHQIEVLQFSPVMRRLMGFGENEEVTFQRFLGRVEQDDREWLANTIEHAHDPAGDGMFAVEYRVRVSDSTVRWVSVRSQTFFEGEGSDRRPVCTIGAVLDVSEQKEAQVRLERLVAERTTQLVEANANLQHFAYTAAHDLRSPLRAIGSFASLSLERYGEQLDAMGRSMLERVVASANQMGQLLSDLLEYSKIGQTEMRLESVPLEWTVGEVLRLLEEEILRKEADVSVMSPLPEVLAHPATLVMLLSNLVSNGLKFVPEGVKPRLRIWTEVLLPEHREGDQPHESEGSQVRLWVEDNGIGIAAEDQERVFGVFQRLHAKDTYPGTGLGLSIVRKAAERMDGHVGVESEQGRGSRFWVELKAA